METNCFSSIMPGGRGQVGGQRQPDDSRASSIFECTTDPRKLSSAGAQEPKLLWPKNTERNRNVRGLLIKIFSELPLLWGVPQKSVWF